MNRNRIIIMSVLAGIVVAWFALDLDRYLTFQSMLSLRDDAQAWYASAPWAAAAVFLGTYFLMAALSIPGAAVMTVLAGAVFGLGAGTVLVSLGSTLGATAAMLIGRYLFRDVVRRRFASQVERIDEGIRSEGAFYLLALRLVPVFPFFAVNLAMALTGMRTLTYLWVSMVGMLPGTIVYVNAGTTLGELSGLDGILAPEFILSFTALGILPLVSSRILDRLRARRAQKGFERPRAFDRNLIVIGAGAAGLVSAYIAATVRARVTLIERERMGGDCLNTGCVPSKALLRAARAVRDVRTARAFGVEAGEPTVDFSAVMAHVRGAIDAIAPHDSVERYTALGVECLSGDARIVSPWCVEVGGRRLTTRSIVIAAGARPAVPPIPGLAEAAFLTSDTLWSIDTLPGRLVVLGGGPIGCELAQAFARLGAEVTIVEMAEGVLVRDDPDASALVAAALQADGVRLKLGARATRVEAGAREEEPASDTGATRPDEDAQGQAAGDVADAVNGSDGAPAAYGGTLYAEADGVEVAIPYDRLLVAVGRKPNTEGYGLEALGIPTGDGGVVQTNAYLQTLQPNIYACGDVAGPMQFTHVAGHQAWYAAVNALFGGFRRFRVDYRAIPRVTYTDPELAAVGLTEAQAREQDLDCTVTRYDLADLDRAIVDGETGGFVKVLTRAGSDEIIGATIAGAHAGELIATFVLAMAHGFGLKKILGTVHAYPTMMEANKYVAGNWRRAHAPQRVLDLLERYHAWQRG